MPIIIWLSFNMLVTSSLNLFIEAPPPLEYVGTTEGHVFSYSLPPFYGYAVLGLCIYVSIKIWIKYVHQN